MEVERLQAAHSRSKRPLGWLMRSPSRRSSAEVEAFNEFVPVGGKLLPGADECRRRSPTHRPIRKQPLAVMHMAARSRQPLHRRAVHQALRGRGHRGLDGMGRRRYKNAVCETLRASTNKERPDRRSWPTRAEGQSRGVRVTRRLVSIRRRHATIADLLPIDFARQQATFRPGRLGNSGWWPTTSRPQRASRCPSRCFRPTGKHAARR
jgi:hypothetical protein